MTDKKNKSPFYLIDTSAEFYRPRWLRITICVAVAIWAVLEIYHGEGFWGVIAGAAAIYCTYVLLVTYTPPPIVEPVVRPPDEDEDEDEPAATSEVTTSETKDITPPPQA